MTDSTSYQSEDSATQLGLISISPTSVRFGVDSSNVVSETSRGRPSVRIQSYNSFTDGLFVADIAHMPGDACGIWPSFWTLGAGTWPQNGEIDIIEGVNLNTKNLYTLHTGDGTCEISPTGETGTQLSSDCTTTQNGQIVNTAGCSIQANVQNNYGDAFNNNQGGTYVMQWTNTFINMWFFPRGQEPATLNSPSPDVSQFGIPDANFAGCDIGSYFADNSLVFGTNFCGDWAANDGVYPNQCPITVPNAPAWKSCVQQVANNPGAYSEGFWEVNFIKIFSEATTPPPSSSSTQSSTSSSTQSSTSSSSASSPSSPVVSSASSQPSTSVPTSPTTTPPPKSVAATTPAITSTVYSTNYYTITACPSSVTNCPANQMTTAVITSVVPVTASSTLATTTVGALSPVSTPNPESQHTSPGFKGYATTPQAAGTSAAGNATATATGATKSSPAQVSVNSGERRRAAFLALAAAVMFAVVAA